MGGTANEKEEKGMGVSSESDIEDQADVLHVGACQVFENWDEVKQLVVVGVREPTADGYGVLRVEDVGRRRIVDDDRVFQVSSHLGEILDVVSLVVVAALAEKPVVNDLVDVELVQKGVAVLKDGVSQPNTTILVEQCDLTLETDAVKTTTSYSSPTRFMN